MTDTNGTASAPKNATICRNLHDGYVCTLDRDHEGDHEAHDMVSQGGELLTSWPADDPNNVEEPREYAIRQQLGLRPIFYKKTEDDGGALHPDTRPCPAWCEMSQMGFQHSVNPRRPLLAEHDSTLVNTLASLYHGSSDQSGVTGATIECKLSSRGQGRPLIEVNLRGNDLDSDTMTYERLVNLTLDDAADLVTALQYLIAQADAADVLADGERNAFELGRDYERGSDAPLR